MSEELMKSNCSMSIAGLDTSGGAGILADCKTFHSLGVYATCVITAITAQNPFEVKSIEDVDVTLLEEEIDCIMDVYPIEYVKTGMLYSEDIVRTVSSKIREYQLKAVVDPVMISESGADLTSDNFASFLNKHLVKNAFLITPNIHEAEKLSDMKITCEEDMVCAAEKLGSDVNVVITGGHLEGNDVLFEDDKLHRIEGSLIDSSNTHGTGCTYSSAVTSYLIYDNSLYDSCVKANSFVQKAIKAGFNRTPNQFFKG